MQLCSEGSLTCRWTSPPKFSRRFCLVRFSVGKAPGTIIRAYGLPTVGPIYDRRMGHLRNPFVVRCVVSRATVLTRLKFSWRV